MIIALVTASAALGWAAWWRSAAPADGAAVADAAVTTAEYVGAAACLDCHAEQHDAWTGSHHDLAMQVASAESVLGDFDGATFGYAGTTSTFTRRDGRFYVNTDGPDGRLADYEITHTFGVTPLQQYLVAFPGGRLQALSIAWDSRPRAQGGQRWFHLYPDEAITAGDPLHWTGLHQNWNFTCAECHSTDLKKAYDPGANVYRTRWAEIDVACEACHGPGSRHVSWARESPDRRAQGAGTRDDRAKGLTIALDERRGVAWRPDASTGTARRTARRESTREIDTCARCHARARRTSDDYVHGRSPLETHALALLDESIYWADGQMRGEVYNWGSFVQSRMYHEGVTCSDCHEPHSLRLRAPGNAVCAQCHLASQYDDVGHTRHAQGTPAAACASCHMPVTTYMQIDPRHDHSFRIPRPDLSVRFGVPNACSTCHATQPAQWAADAIATWTGRPPQAQLVGADDRDDGRVVAAMHASSAGAPGARAALAAIVRDATRPAIVRATALRRLAPFLTAGVVPTVAAASKDPDPLVRMAAVETLGEAEPPVKARHVAPLLDDRVRGVRIEAASAIAGPAERLLSAEDRRRFRAALAEHEASLRYNADRPEGRLGLGNLYRTRGDIGAAIAAYRGALALDPAFAEAYVNLADVHRARGAETESAAILREGLTRAPRSAVLHHALGLAMVRQQRRAEAALALEKAATLAPETPRYAYTYAVALHDWGQPRRAFQVLESALDRHPNDPDVLMALASYAAAAGEVGAAQRYRERLQALNR